LRASISGAGDCWRDTPVIPRAIWLLGLVSLFMDISSEMIHGLLPLFLVSALGASAVTLGLIEGIAEGTASVVKVFSGVCSDRMGRRKPLALAGYGLAALTKPLFPLATSAAWVFTARCVDRLGKGLRGAPRDALVADLAPEAVRGAAFGLRQSLDTVGAFVGPLAAIALMLAFANDYRAVFWVAVAPAFASAAILAFTVREPAQHAPGTQRGLPRLADLRGLRRACWIVIAVGVVFTLARFSEAFLVLRVHDSGVDAAWAPGTLVVMNVAYAAVSYPAGQWSDRNGRLAPLVTGLVVLVIADVILAFGSSPALALAGVALWGVHMGLTQGLLAALVADTAPAALRGAAFGVFHFASGIAALLASLLAGTLWQALGPGATFLAGAAFSALALAGLVLAGPVRKPAE
jgi:MFS family permease